MNQLGVLLLGGSNNLFYFSGFAEKITNQIPRKNNSYGAVATYSQISNSANHANLQTKFKGKKLPLRYTAIGSCQFHASKAPNPLFAAIAAKSYTTRNGLSSLSANHGEGE